MPETLFETKWIGLYREGRWDYVRRPNARATVGILAVTPDRELLLVEQFRIPVGCRVVEVPAGLVGDEAPDEPVGEAARRELLEETGWHAGTIRELIASPTSAGLTSEFTHLFLASDLERRGQGGGIDNEEIEVHRVPLDDLRGWLRDRESAGRAIDFKIHAALWLAGW